MLTRLIHFVGVASIILFAAACGGDDGPPDDPGLEYCPPDSDAEQAEGQQWITFSCTNFCHSESRVGDARGGAPEGMNFDTPEQMIADAQAIYDSIVRTENPMPPNGSLRRDQIELVRIFLACGLAGQ